MKKTTRKQGRPRIKPLLKTIQINSGTRGAFTRYLIHNRQINVAGLGVFTVRKVKECKRFHNFSGKIINIPEKYKVHFVASPSLINQLKQ